jgi:hypothetical protein
VKKLANAFLVLGILLMLSACQRNSTRTAERAIPQTAAASGMKSQPNAAAQLASVNATDVGAAVQRVFGDAVRIESARDPKFVIGDFNGDASPDLMVVVRPAQEKLPEINNDLANWAIQNPLHAYIPPKNKRVVAMPPRPKTEKVRAGESLIAVIHGFGPDGWRNSLARQAYLLREAVGHSMQVCEPSASLISDFGAFPSPRQVVGEDPGPSHGVLYWTGAMYAWHLERATETETGSRRQQITARSGFDSDHP